MKVILTEKMVNLGNIGDVVDVATGYARNYLLPNKKALRFTKANAEVFEQQKKDLEAKHATAKKSAEALVSKVEKAKLYMIRQAGDTGHLYGSVSTRDIARALSDQGIAVESNQILLGNPIKTVGMVETSVALHADVIVPIRVYIAPTNEEIEALVAGKSAKPAADKAVEKETAEKSEEIAE